MFYKFSSCFATSVQSIVLTVLIAILQDPMDVQNWKNRARSGVATSAFSPVATPCRLTHGLKKVLDETPPPVIRPYRKTQLAAAKRLEKELQNAKGSDLKPNSTKGKRKAKGNKDKKVDKTKGDSKKVPPKRNHGNGPMAAAKNTFMQNMKSEGYSYRECLELWKESEEREAIVQSMSESERKRRRY